MLNDEEKIYVNSKISKLSDVFRDLASNISIILHNLKKHHYCNSKFVHSCENVQKLYALYDSNRIS